MSKSKATTPCPACGGSGIGPVASQGTDRGGVPWSISHRCSSCDGTGQIAIHPPAPWSDPIDAIDDGEPSDFASGGADDDLPDFWEAHPPRPH